MYNAILRRRLCALLAAALALGACSDVDADRVTGADPALSEVFGGELDAVLRSYLASLQYTGRVASTLEARLGRRIDHQLASIGRDLFFDPIQGLNNDNACAGCHSPTHGFGDTQPIAIGIDNNGIVGPNRRGPRNQRRTPMVINNVFYPTLMWNSRFRALSGDPFDNSAGFEFPEPEGMSLSYQPHLLVAQAFIPPTERVEQTGFHFEGDNDDIRAEVARRLNEIPRYREAFARVFPQVRAGGPVTFDHFARAIAEFEYTLVFADAPIDRYARGNSNALTPVQKQGAVLFFGRGGCVQCHAVSGRSNEMFSDFREHVAGIPQITSSWTNVEFDGAGSNEDFGLEQATGSSADRYAFRTSPLRNVALQPAFMHNGAFVRLEDAIRYHLDAISGAATFTTTDLPADLHVPTGPIEPVLQRLDPLLRQPVALTEQEFDALVDFVRNGLLDPAATPQRLRRLIPAKLPSGLSGFTFE